MSPLPWRPSFVASAALGLAFGCLSLLPVVWSSPLRRSAAKPQELERG